MRLGNTPSIRRTGAFASSFVANRAIQATPVGTLLGVAFGLTKPALGGRVESYNF